MGSYDCLTICRIILYEFGIWGLMHPATDVWRFSQATNTTMKRICWSVIGLLMAARSVSPFRSSFSACQLDKHSLSGWSDVVGQAKLMCHTCDSSWHLCDVGDDRKHRQFCVCLGSVIQKAFVPIARSQGHCEWGRVPPDWAHHLLCI